MQGPWSIENAAQLVEMVKKAKLLSPVRIGLLNGCFDLFHVGHLSAIRQATRKCDYLLVAVNSDESVRGLKGIGRPVIKEHDRIEIVSSIDRVFMAFSFSEPTVANVLRTVRPSIWFRGFHYHRVPTPQDELDAATECGCEMVFLEQQHNESTTGIIQRIHTAQIAKDRLAGSCYPGG